MFTQASHDGERKGALAPGPGARHPTNVAANPAWTGVALAAGAPVVIQRSAVPGFESVPAGETSPGERGEVPLVVPPPAPPPGRVATPLPETCPPPAEMPCPPAPAPPGAVAHELRFRQDSATLTSLQKFEIDAVAAAWHAAGGGVTVRVDGFASAEGDCPYNWDLSCRRARAVVAALTAPSDGSPGVPAGSIELFAHGESNAGGSTLAPNRRATISLSVPPPPPAPPSPPPCAFPVPLGSARGCAGGPDFGHFDYPPNTLSAASLTKLTLWALGRPTIPPRPSHHLITDTECEIEMDAVLVALAGSVGHRAFARFAAGTGGTETHPNTSALGALALASPSFRATVAAVQADIERQLAVQAAAGALDPCALSVTPPATHFSVSDGWTLKAVIGGTQGETLSATAFTGNVALRTYTIDLEFAICDDFGVDESDLYAPGLFPFWVLQHERSASLYAPFINELDLTISVTGTF